MTFMPPTPPEFPEPTRSREDINHDVGTTLLAFFWTLIIIVLIMIIPEYTYTMKFWIDGVSDTIFNFNNMWGR